MKKCSICGKDLEHYAKFLNFLEDMTKYHMNLHRNDKIEELFNAIKKNKELSNSYLGDLVDEIEKLDKE